MPDSPSPAAAPASLAPGQLFGTYRIHGLLGRGGMGAVYQAEVVEDGRLVALKLLAGGIDDSDTRRRFLREGHLAASLNHPNTVYIYGTGEVDGIPVIAMELVAGGTLESRIESQGPLPIADIIDAGLEIVAGLAAAHDLGILHRDIKPSNCFVGLDGAVKVGDFGLSKSVEAGHSTITKTGMFMGTPAYSSPEQLLGEALDARSDIYSVGGTLYYLLTGRIPFDGATPMNVIAAVLKGVPVSPRAYRPDIPEPLAAVVLKCLARDPANRYPDYHALRADLEACRSVPPVPAPVGGRIGALAIDVVGTVSLALPFLLIPGLARVMDGDGVGPTMASNAFVLFCVLLWKGLPEGLWGASPGKALLGFKVVRPNGEPIGLLRSVIRSVSFWLPVVLPDLVLVMAGLLDRSSEFADLAMMIFLASAAALFVTMRRRNGFAALHDVIAGTRVIRVPPVSATRRVALPPSALPDVPEQAERLGQFALIRPLGSLADGSELIAAVDPALRRPVWVHRYPDPRPALDPARRNLAREGRVRWVAGRRGPEENWDAYEVPEGQSLLSPDLPPVAWPACRSRLTDLAAELDSAKEAGEPIPLALDRVWLTAGGRALILDFPVGPASPPVTQPGAFFQQVAARSLGAEWPILPMAARQLLEELPALETPAAVGSRLSAMVDGPAALTRRKRGLALALTASPALLMAMGALVWLNVTEVTDPALVRLMPALEYLERQPRWETDSARAVHYPIVATYLASHGEILSNPAHRRGPAEDRIRWEQIDSALRQYAGASAEARAAAARTVDSVWRNTSRGPLRPARRGPLLAVGAGLFVLGVIGLISLGVALLFRTGFAFRTAGIEIVTRDGRPAGRLWLLLRALVVWLPLLLPLGFLTNGATAFRIGQTFRRWTSFRFGDDIAAQVLAAGSLVLLIFGLVAVAVALRNPVRGVADRIAGTWLVPR